MFVLLLAGGLAVPGLDADALWYDEIRTYQHAGGAHYGPKAFGDVWDALATNAPDQAPGYFLALNAWGWLVGWTEFAVRALSMLAGLLGLAFVFRAGRDLFGKPGGYVAALVLATNAFYIHFMHEARAFGIGMMAVGVVVWGYWYLMTVRFRWSVAVIFVLGALVAVYTHYFVAIFLLALALYHLFFGPPTWRWWLPVAMAVPVIVIFLPALFMLQGGIAKNTENARLEELAMNAPGVVWAAFRYFGNGLPVGAAALIGLGVLFVLQDWRRSERYIAFLTIATLGLIILVNNQIPVLAPGRERYLAGVWVILSLIWTAAVMAVWRLQRWAAAVIVALWVVWGLFVTVSDRQMTLAGSDVLAWRDLVEVVERDLEPSDVLAFHAPKFPWGTQVPFEFYKQPLPIRAELVESLETEPVMRAYTENAKRVWLGVDWRYPPEAQYDTFTGLLSDDFVACDRLLWAANTELNLYARSQALCPADVSLAQFGDRVTLVNHTPIVIADETLMVSVQWNRALDTLAEPYSVGFQLFGDDELVAQQDIGLPPTPTFISDVAIQMIDVPPGVYQLNTLVYNWQTGERLPMATAETILTLDTVNVAN